MTCDMAKQSIGERYRVDRPLGQVRCEPFEFDMEVHSSWIARQPLGKRGDTHPHKGLSKPGTGVKSLKCRKRLACHRAVPFVVRSTVSSWITTR
jgi:hypothetical protein